MRITSELYHNGSASTLDMPEAEMERRSMDLRVACNPSLRGQFETPDPHVAPYSAGTGAARGPIARAISRLAAYVLEGLAAYGEGMYPDFAGVARVWIVSPVARSWSWMRREWEVGRTVAALQKLDDRTLKDMGLYRCQIASVVRDAHRDNS